MLAQILAERLLGLLLDHKAEHVEAEAIVPHGAGLMQQRCGARAIEELLAVHVRAEAPLPSGNSLCTAVVPRPP